MSKCYDELSPLDKLDDLIAELESELPYRTDGDDRDRLNYMVMVNLRSARVGLQLDITGESRTQPQGDPRWGDDLRRVKR